MPKKEAKKGRVLFNFINSLTSREKDIVCLLLMNKGIQFDEVASRLYLHNSTVRKYASNIYKKAGVKNKKQLLALCEGFEPFLIGCAPESMTQSPKNADQSEWLMQESKNEHYFEAFSEVAEAMHQLDFSRRLIPSGHKNSFFNLVAEGLNLVNEELESKFLRQDIIPSLIEALSTKNRIVLLAKKDNVIAHAFSSIGVGSLNPGKWVGLKLSDFVGHQLPISENISHQKIELSQAFIPVYLRGDADFSLECNGAYKIVTISIFPEHNFSEKMPRILTLISSLKSQFDDNPSLSQTVLGAWVYNEVNELYDELEEFIFL